MIYESDPRLVHRLSYVAVAAGIFPIVVGLFGIAGWMFSIPFFNTWGATPVTMKMNTAICFVLCGVSLLLLQKQDNHPIAWIKKAVAGTAAATVSLITFLSLVENLFGWDFGIDQLLATAPPAAQTASLRAGLMSPITAGAFLFLSIGLLLIDWQTRRGWPAQYLALSAGAGATFGVFSFAFDPHIYSSHLSLALPTAVTLTGFSLGLLCSRTQWGLGAMLCSKSLGGSLARRLLPAAFIPVVVGWIRWQITAIGLFSQWDTVVVSALTTMSLLAALIAWAAKAVDRSDEERRKVETALHISGEQLDRLLNRIDEAPDEAYLRRKVVAGFSVAILLTAVLGFLSWRNAQQAAHDADWVAHSHEVLTTLEITIKHLGDVETGGRGFALSGHQPFLQSFQAGRQVLGQDLSLLIHLVADNPIQVRRTQALEQQVAAKIQASNELITARQQKGTVPGLEQLEHGRQLMNAASATVQQMEDEEKQLLAERTRKTQSARNLTISVMGLGSLLGVIFLVAAGFAISRQLGISARARAQVDVLNADLERRVEQRTIALRESEGQLAGVIKSAMDSIITVDDQQRVVLFNEAAERMFRCPAAEALGQPITRFIPQRFREAHGDHIQKFGETGVTNRSMGTMRSLWAMRSDGEEFQIEASISQVEAAGKKMFTVILRDVTERKQAEQIRERLAAVVDSSDDAIINKSLDGTIIAWNRGAEKVYGYTVSEAVGKSMLMLIPPDRLGEEAEILTHIKNNKSVEHFETVRVRKDGRKIDVSVTISPIRDSSGTIIGASKIARDITERKRIEEALREQAQVLDLATVFVRDTAGHIVVWNQGAEKLYGYSKQEAIGKISHQLLQTEFPVPIDQIESKLMTSGTWEGELTHRKQDGSKIVVASTWVLYRDSNGQPIRVVEANTDITFRKQAEEQLSTQAEELFHQAEELSRSRYALETQSLMLQSVLDSMAEGLVATDEKGKFVIWNPAAEKILGLGAANMPSQHWSEHYGLFLPDMVTPFPTEQLPLVLAIRGESSSAQMFVRNPSLPEGAWIEASAGPLKDKDSVIRGGVVAFRDITQKRADDQEIRRLNEELEQRVIQRTAQLEEANKELEAFTYSVSHDLRAPLRHMAGFSGILLEEYGPSLDAQAKKYLGRIQDATGRMGRLVDELLTLARVGRQSPNLQVTGLDSIVQEVVAILEPDTEGRQINWKISKLPFVECDPTLIKQVFQNLISNALKYSRPRAKAVIEVGQTETNGHTAIFIRDNGVGFSMKYADKLFGVFQRLHRAEDFEGTGVGLATVQRIIKKHHGRIWAEAELDRGATFYFTLSGLEHAQLKTEAASVGA